MYHIYYFFHFIFQNMKKYFNVFQNCYVLSIKTLMHKLN